MKTEYDYALSSCSLTILYWSIIIRSQKVEDYINSVCYYLFQHQFIGKKNYLPIFI